MNNMIVRKRFKHLFFVFLISISILGGYYFIYDIFPSLRLKCHFFQITGLKCPSCGITRLVVAFLHLDFKQGIAYNCFLGYTLPFIVFVIGYCSWAYVYDRKYSKWFNVLSVVYIVLLLVFFVIRNIVGI